MDNTDMRLLYLISSTLLLTRLAYAGMPYPDIEEPQMTPISYLSTDNRVELNLKSGFSINRAKENELIKSSDTYNITISSKKTTASNNIPFHIGITYPFNDKFSGTISGIFIPEHNIKTVARGMDKTYPALYYLNAATSSYGVMANLNLELYKINKLSHHISIGGGVMLNSINNAELVVDYSCNPNKLNRNIVLFNYNKVNFAWTVGTGVKYKINEKISVGIDYSYLNRGKVYTKDAFDRTGKSGYEGNLLRKGAKTLFKNLNSHQMMLGLNTSL